MTKTPPECTACRPPEGLLTRGDEHLFPAAWQAPADAPDWVSRGSEIRQCASCGRYWYVFFHPKDMIYSDIFVLPDHAAPLLEESALPRVWPAVEAHEHFVTGLVQNWFINAPYDLEAAVRGLLDRIGRATTDARHVHQYLVYLRSVLYGEEAQRVWKRVRHRAPPIELRSLSPLLGALEAGGSQHMQERVAREVDEIVRGFFGRAFGRAVSFVDAPDGQIAALFDRSGNAPHIERALKSAQEGRARATRRPARRV